MLTCFLSVAVAATPSVVVAPDHSVSATVDVPLAAEAVRQRLADPAWIAATDGGSTVRVESRADGCLVMSTSTPSVAGTLNYRVKRCPTPTGYREDLVDGDAFDAYSVVWSVAPSGPGSRIQYTIHTHTTWMVPQAVVDQQTSKSVTHLLTRLSEALALPVAQ